MKNTLIVESNKQGKKYQKTFTNLNPNASDSAVEGFAQAATALTGNEYQGAYMVTKRNVDGSEPYGGGSTITIAGDTVTVTVEAEPVTVTVEASGKEIPAFSLGGWSKADSVYSAAITYSGDGELSVNVGSISNGVLTVADEDGVFSGVITASAGESYAGVALNFDYDTDTITVQGGGGSVATELVQSLGSKFVPTVDNATDFATFADNNIQFFDNRIKKVIEGGKDFSLEQSNTFYYGATTITTVGPQRYGAVSLVANGVTCTYNNINRFCTVGTSGDLTYDSTVETYKINEVIGLTYAKSQVHSLNTHFRNQSGYNIFVLQAEDSVKTVNYNIALANSANPSELPPLPSCMNFVRLINSNGALVERNYSTVSGGKTTIATYLDYSVLTDRKYTNLDGRKATVSASYYLTDSSPNLVEWGFITASTPVISFNGEDVTIAKGQDEHNLPLYLLDVKNSNPKNRSIYLAGNESLTPYVLSTVQNKVDITVNPWIEDDGSAILGLYSTDNGFGSVFAATYKPGTYSKDDFLNDAFDVYFVDYNTPAFVKTDKTLAQLADLVIV